MLDTPANSDPETINLNHTTTSYLVGQLRHHGNYTLGVILTAVEAALGDSKQSDALKAITRREMFALMDRNQGEIYESAGMQKPGLQPKETWVDGQDYLKEQKEYEEKNQ